MATQGPGRPPARVPRRRRPMRRPAPPSERAATAPMIVTYCAHHSDPSRATSVRRYLPPVPPARSREDAESPYRAVPRPAEWRDRRERQQRQRAQDSAPRRRVSGPLLDRRQQRPHPGDLGPQVRSPREDRHQCPAGTDVGARRVRQARLKSSTATGSTRTSREIRMSSRVGDGPARPDAKAASKSSRESMVAACQPKARATSANGGLG